MDIVEIMRVDPFVFRVVDFKATVRGNADAGQIDDVEEFEPSQPTIEVGLDSGQYR